MFITIFQSIAYYQNSNVALIWIDRSVDLEVLGYRVPTGWFNSIDPFVSIVAVPFILASWRRQALRGAEPAEMAKIGTGAWIACAAPPRVRATLMGTAFMSLFLSNVAIGRIGGAFEKMTPTEFWALHAAIAAVGGVLAWTLGRRLECVLAPPSHDP